MELPYLIVESTDPGAGSSWQERPAVFEVGSFVVAVYEILWYLAKVTWGAALGGVQGSHPQVHKVQGLR